MGTRILINGQGHSLEHSGGVGQYTHEMLRRLRQPELYIGAQRLEPEFTGFPELVNPVIPTKTTPLLEQPNSASFKHWLKNNLSPSAVRRLKDIKSRLWSPTAKDKPEMPMALTTKPSFPKITDSEFILHELSNYKAVDPIGRWALSRKMKLAVTFLDIQDYYYPEYFDDWALNHRRFLYSFYKDRADLFFSISHFTKQTMIERLGIPENKIIVTHLGSESLNFTPAPKSELEWAKSFGRFIIYPAKPWRHKNHQLLLQAIGALQEHFRREKITLLLSGGFDPSALKEIRSQTQELGILDLIEVLGFLSKDQLNALIQKAEFLVFPSHFEGFGMPLLEAMINSCPVIASRSGSIPEVAGDAALFFDSNNLDELIEALRAALINQNIDRDNMIRKGLKNATKFKWEKTFNETLKGYQLIQ